MTIRPVITYTVTCDRCGNPFRNNDLSPSNTNTATEFVDLETVERFLRKAQWIPDHQRLMVDGEQDALQVCAPCRRQVENEVTQERGETT